MAPMWPMATYTTTVLRQLTKGGVIIKHISLKDCFVCVISSLKCAMCARVNAKVTHEA